MVTLDVPAGVVLPTPLSIAKRPVIMSPHQLRFVCTQPSTGTRVFALVSQCENCDQSAEGQNRCQRHSNQPKSRRVCESARQCHSEWRENYRQHQRVKHVLLRRCVAQVPESCDLLRQWCIGELSNALNTQTLIQEDVRWPLGLALPAPQAQLRVRFSWVKYDLGAGRKAQGSFAAVAKSDPEQAAGLKSRSQLINEHALLVAGHPLEVVGVLSVLEECHEHRVVR
jgi:hypothetical protein